MKCREQKGRKRRKKEKGDVGTEEEEKEEEEAIFYLSVTGPGLVLVDVMSSTEDFISFWRPKCR